MTTPPGIEETPKNHTIVKLNRNSTLAIVVAFVVVVLGMIVLGIIANGGRLASVDSSNSTGAQFAVQVRAACTSERRDARDSATGRMNEAALLAQKALKDKDEGEYDRQIGIGIAAAKDFEHWVILLEPRNLNKDVEDGGCGPPVTSTYQVRHP